MSTEHANPSTPLGAGEHDAEYGPTPPGANYEHTDIDVAIGYQFALWLAVAMVISFGIVYGTFWFFEGQARSANAAAQRFPLAAGLTRDVPTPTLQTQPFKDVYVLKAEQDQRLHSYGWVDKEGGVTRLPIERAMEVLLQRGLPVRSDAAAGPAVVTQDSSSGRTVAPR
jgi:hypothetical protein